MQDTTATALPTRKQHTATGNMTIVVPEIIIVANIVMLKLTEVVVTQVLTVAQKEMI